MPGAPADHDELRRRMACFLPLLDANGHQSDVLLRERLEFSRIFQAHSAREAEEVAARAAADHIFARTAAAYRDQLERIRADYSAHIARWTPAAIRADAAGYRSDVVALQRQFHTQLSWEDRYLAAAPPPLPSASSRHYPDTAANGQPPSRGPTAPGS
jgi:hypothetical protein